MFDYNGGFLFVGRDNGLYFATFDAEGEGLYSSGQPWTVTLVRTEWWSGAYPTEGWEE